MKLPADPWTVDAAILGEVVGDSLREIVNCWVRGQVPTAEQANEVTRAQMCLSYLVARANGK